MVGPEALPTLGTILNAESDFVNRRFVIVAIGDLGPKSESATFILHDFFLARNADPQNRSEMNHVVEAMGRLQNDSSFEVLSGWIERRDDPAIQVFRDRFVKSLGEHPRRDEAVDLVLVGIYPTDDALRRAEDWRKLEEVKALEEAYRF